ncbi:DNA-binding response regulator [Yeosuana aromativorans]|uniref:DNA-binding response regulator n=1 Tax=Yeosuana aromativorans TaxID=288019 RepID=A0A8J3BSI8_9FLAO|nr:response regulator transcription factor [Yeosuana aromativorans]GGK35472.1 DNA-binding response regulator [Yeosuana aromativorans]
MKIKILLVDDHQILRDGIRNVIERSTTMEVIAEAKDGREAIKLCNQLKPNIVIMDIAMEGLNGVEATKRIVQENPETKVIALSMHSSKRFVLGMLKAGAYGYLLKDCDSDELIKAIKTVSINKKYIAQNISDVILSEFISGQHEEMILTPREKEILQLIAEGKSSKVIGEILFLSSKTIDVHRKNIMDKLELYSLPELTKYALKTGLISLDE